MSAIWAIRRPLQIRQRSSRWLKDVSNFWDQSSIEMKKIGKYEIRATIGEGGMGTVYKAFDPFLKRDVAIKVISETLFAKDEVKERFSS